MDFSLTPEQEHFRDTIRRLVDEAPLVATGANAESYAATWRRLAELGVAGLCVPEDRGGFSGQAEDFALIAVELGRSPTGAIRLEPVVAAASLLTATTPDGGGRLEALIAGEIQPAVALDICDAAPLMLEDSGGYYRLDGLAAAVVGGETADLLVAVACRRHADQLAIVTVDLSAADVERRAYRLADTTPVADLRFSRLRVSRSDVTVSNDNDAAIASARDAASIALCASAVGGMERAIELTVDYLKTRQQFKRPLAEFQALQHQVADMFMLANDARSMLYGAVAASRSAPEARMRAVAGCRIKVGDAAKEVTGRALHLHGGIGFTTEYLIGHLFRRAMVDDRLLGSREAALALRGRLAGGRPIASAQSWNGSAATG